MDSSNAARKFVRRPVVQVVAHLLPKLPTPKENAHSAIQVILGWLSKKQKLVLPPQAHAGESFDLDASESFPVAAVQFDEFWSVQFDRFDSDVPGRIWRTEATVAYTGEVALAGVRLAVIDTIAHIDFSASVPAVVTDLILAPGMVDYGYPLSTDAFVVRNLAELTRLIDLIEDGKRTRPVVVFTAAPNVNTYLEGRITADRLPGLAHVFVIDEQASRMLTTELGREFSVWGGAVRAYMPNFDPSIDETSKHPLATRNWINRRFKKTEDFAFYLLQLLAPISVRRGNIEEDLPPFRSIRQARIQQQLAQTTPGGSVEREILLEKENELLRVQLTEKSEEFDYADEVVKKAEEERDLYRAQAFSLRQRIDQLEREQENFTIDVEYPISLASLSNWAFKNLPGRLILLTRASRAAGKSPFNEPALVYRCLERLAREYVDARRNGGEIENIFADLGVHLERTGDPDSLKQWRNEYFVTHRGKSVCLDWHLKKGTDKNDATTMRIYFFYDEDDEQVVVGHLPGHLRNSKS